MAHHAGGRRFDRSTLWGVSLLAVVAWLGGCAAGPIERGSVLRGDQAWVIRDTGALRDGGRQRIVVRLGRPEALDLRVPFDEAPFNGTQLLARVNGTRLAPYFAFGGDTRYDRVRGEPGSRPPLATIEGRWVIPPSLLRAGRNDIDLWTTGVTEDEALREMGPKPAIRIREVRIARAEGGDLPRYANSIYYDFAVWSQGFDWGPDPRRFHFDQALLGVINGSGMPNIGPNLGAPEQELWGVKRQAEDMALRWGYGHQEFYTIWEFAEKPDLWARYVDADGKPETQSKFHTQAIFEHVLSQDAKAKGADVVLYDPARYAAALEPAIKMMAPYADYYNFKCEQHGPWGQGFEDDGERWAAQGLHGDAWARNFYEASKAARDLVRRHDPEDGRVQEMNHWLPSIRHVLFDTSLRRGQPMGDTIDALMTHFGSVASYDRDAQGKMVPGEDPLRMMERQYPGGTFAPPPKPRWIGHVARGGIQWYKDTAYPEVGLDFNRYRLGRTEADLLPGLDPAAHRWGNGDPFDYRAGLRGDELMYNSENGIWQGYSAPSAYQYLQGVFSYGLLPTGAHEPRDLKITTRQSLTQTTDVGFNLYGKWVDGAGHTKRLRTADPLYGDMFGWTGNEHCNAGDYITMVGIKDRHHRLPPHDAYGLVRRICYAFVTSGPIVPAYVGADHEDSLFVKTMTQVFDGQRYVGIYAVNFDERPRTMDVTVPLPMAAGAKALVFDDRAGDWSDGRWEPVKAGNGFRYRQEVPAKSPWLVLLPMPEDGLAGALGAPAAPRRSGPRYDEAIDADRPALTWGASPGAARYRVEVAREAKFRAEDRIELSDSAAAGTSYVVRAALEPRGRYFWRVQAVDAAGRRGEWSAPSPFVYRWPEYSQRFPAQDHDPGPGTPPAQPVAPGETPAWQTLAKAHGLETTPNLAWSGEIYGTGGHMHAPSRASDGQAFSSWTSADNENLTEFPLPAEWAVLWPEPVRISSVKVLWLESALPKGFAVQVSDDARTWTDLLTTDAPPQGQFTEVKPAQPVSGRYLRITIPAAVNEKRDVGIREVVVR